MTQFLQKKKLFFTFVTIFSVKLRKMVKIAPNTHFPRPKKCPYQIVTFFTFVIRLKEITCP